MFKRIPTSTKIEQELRSWVEDVWNVPHGAAGQKKPRREGIEIWHDSDNIYHAALVESVERLLDVLSLPGAIGSYPDAERERAIMDYALPSGSSRANPVPVDEGFVRAILRAVCT